MNEYLASMFAASLAYMEERPYLTATYILIIIMISALAAYKCKTLKSLCRRRNQRRRRRKPRSHYYYLNKSSADQMAVADPLMGAEAQGVQMGTKQKKSKSKGRKGKGANEK